MATMQLLRNTEKHEEIGGGHFSQTSTNIQLKNGGAELSALCKTIAGTWVPGTLSLHTFLANTNGSVHVALPDERPGSYEKTCKNLKLVCTSQLSGEAQRYDGLYVPFTFNLDDFVVNDDGKLHVRASLFSRTSKDITFSIDGKLSASCQKMDGAWVPSQLDLDYLVENIDGTLCHASPPPAGRFMESCTNVKLVRTNLSGRAKCYDGTYKTFHIQLDYNISNQDGKLVWSTNPPIV